MSDEKMPLMRSFEIPFEIEEVNRLSILSTVFSEMDAAETRRALNYLMDKYVTHRRPDPESDL